MAFHAFLDTFLVQHASPGAFFPPELRKEATHVILTILSQVMLDPRKPLREALDKVVHGRRNMECVRALQRFEGMRDYKIQCGQGVVVAAASRQTSNEDEVH